MIIHEQMLPLVAALVLVCRGQDPDFITFLDRNTGLIGDRIECINTDSGENDYFRINLDTDLGFFKNIQATGKWDVRLILHCDDAWANQ